MAADTFDLRKALVQRLESLERAGVRQLARPSIRAPLAASESPLQQPALAPAEPLPSTAKSAAMPPADDASLHVIQAEVACCTRCPELAAHRTHTVFGVGNPRARLCFLGEAPGADEDKQGEPFVGRAGKLLTDIIERGMKLTRQEVYIFNILKCRPPGNRNPLPEEAANCRGYLDRQIALIQPEFICCLGLVAAQNLLGTTETMGRLRGNWYEYQGIRVMCTYHPAYLLRNPPAKSKTWEDIQMLMREMGLPT